MMNDTDTDDIYAARLHRWGMSAIGILVVGSFLMLLDQWIQEKELQLANAAADLQLLEQGTGIRSNLSNDAGYVIPLPGDQSRKSARFLLRMPSNSTNDPIRIVRNQFWLVKGKASPNAEDYSVMTLGFADSLQVRVEVRRDREGNWKAISQFLFTDPATEANSGGYGFRVETISLPENINEEEVYVDVQYRGEPINDYFAFSPPESTLFPRVRVVYREGTEQEFTTSICDYQLEPTIPKIPNRD